MSNDELMVMNVLKYIGIIFLVGFIIVAFIMENIRKNKAKVYYRDREYNELKAIKEMLNKDIQEKELEELKKIVAQKEKELKGK